MGGGFWFLTVFAAEEIPAAIVTYVALLMLLQMGVAPAEATFLSALLFVPWILKPLMRPRIERTRHLSRMLHLVEALLVLSLVLLALSFRPALFFSFPSSVSSKLFTLHSSFLILFLVSLLCAWHELAAHACYERTLSPTLRRLLVVPKLACSQIAVIFTYGALIFLVGALEVYTRQIRYSWSVGCYVAAGILLLFALHHLFWLNGGTMSGLQGPASDHQTEPQPSAKRRMSVIHSPLLTIFLLLLPQALMFQTRVLYLFDTHGHGGLQCTIQEIGFAQGTVGVIAFSIGIALGRLLIIRHGLQRSFWPMAVSIVLSPFVYWGMTMWPPRLLWELCCCTMTAQFLFGFGLGACRHPLSAVFGNRYSNTINMLQIPLVSAAMILPMAASGWLSEQLGYEAYFLVNALSAPVCLLGIYLLRLFTQPQHKSPAAG